MTYTWFVPSDWLDITSSAWATPLQWCFPPSSASFPIGDGSGLDNGREGGGGGGACGHVDGGKSHMLAVQRAYACVRRSY